MSLSDLDIQNDYRSDTDNLLATPERDLPEILLNKIKTHVAQTYHVKRLPATEYASVIEKDGKN